MACGLLPVGLHALMSFMIGAEKGTRTRTGGDFTEFQTVSNGLDHEAKPVHFGYTRFSNGFK